MALQLDEVVERIDAVQLAGVDQTHEQISHPRSIPGLVKQRVPSMKDSFLQRTLDQIVIDWGSRHSQEQREFFPLPETQRKIGGTLKRNGGDDGVRTRDLRRDRPAF